MFVPPIFVEADRDEICRIISDHPLALLAYNVDGVVEAQHIPVILDGRNRLIGHFAANNDVCTSLTSGAEVLLVFSGQDSYVSPNWYPTKKAHHKHVPTWNYQAVHIRGKLTFLTEAKSALAVVGKLTKHFEQRTNGADGWKIADAPKDYIEDMLSKLTPFQIEIEEITAKSKLSQNRNKTDHSSVKDQMVSTGRSELAERMRSQEEGR